MPFPIPDQMMKGLGPTAPQTLRLWRALAPLRSVVSFMNTGAHPDDETSAMLAALGLRDGFDLSYACSTRGEGGQNDIGTEAGAALGVLRTAEMERAADTLNLRLYWLSTAPDDPIHDFGFSKSGIETMGKWGRARTLRRFVEILRTERPDIICPTFLDISGQHGHHRAMTEAAHLVMDMAADPAFDTGQPAWQVKKLYLPAWSGAGQAYDDDLPPPPATLTVQADGSDPVLGLSYENIGQYSRYFHRTQAMGRWIEAGTERNWPLHLVQSHVKGPDDRLDAGLPRTLADLGHPRAQVEIDAALAAYPDAAKVLHHAVRALHLLEGDTGENSHKTARKRTQLAHVIRVAAGVQVTAQAGAAFGKRGDRIEMQITADKGLADAVTVAPVLPDGWHFDGALVIGESAALGDPYPTVHLPDAPRAPALCVRITVQGVHSESRIALPEAPVVLPAHRAEIRPKAQVLNLSTGRRAIDVDVGHDGAEAAFDLPDGVSATATGIAFSGVLEPEIYSFTLRVDGAAAQTVQQIDHSHIAPRALATPAVLDLLVVDVALPPVRIGYIGGGHDRVDHWLSAIGLDVTRVEDDALCDDAVLAGFDTLVIGIFAMKFRDKLAGQMPRLHRWTKAGGTLLTLYHRPWDNWNSETIPPQKLEIGQPSLRWRVTDETAVVTALVPDHPLLTRPNRIGDADWQGWHKERGLYFAKSWDAAYTPLLQMADPEEQPQHGALLAADIGKGRHVHCALILHHQMEKLVPGAFRLMANLVAKRD